jgi:hypothetical protein
MGSIAVFATIIWICDIQSTTIISSTVDASTWGTRHNLVRPYVYNRHYPYRTTTRHPEIELIRGGSAATGKCLQSDYIAAVLVL